MILERFFKCGIISPDGNTTYQVTSSPGEPGITENSLNLNEILCDNNLELGACNANKLEMQIYGIDEDITGYWIILQNTYFSDQSQTVRPITWFKGIIDSAKTDSTNTYRDIIAYDYMYTLRDYDVTEWYDNYIIILPSTNTTLADLRTALCNYVGVVVATPPTLPNDDLVLKLSTTSSSQLSVPTFDNVSFGELLKWICELQCCVPNITRYGQLEFVPIGIQAPRSAIDITDTYARNDTEVEDYTITQIEGVSAKSGGTVLQTIPLAASWRDSNIYVIQDNPFLTNATERQIGIVLTQVYLQLQNVSYTPATVEMIVSDYDIRLGYLLKINNQRCNASRCTTTYHLVLSQTYSGPMLVDQTIESSAMGERQAGSGGIIINDPIPINPDPII